MPLYLSESLIGAGTILDPKRPAGSDQPGWGVLYLGDTGKSLLWLPAESNAPGLVRLGDGPDARIDGASRRVLADRLGLKLALTRLGDLLAEIINSSEDWNPLEPVRGRYEIWLDNRQWYDAPAVGGGATASDNFDRADANPLSGNWTAGGGAWGVLKLSSNRVRSVLSDVHAMHTCSTPAFTANQWSEATIYGESAQFPGLTVRVTGNVSYMVQVAFGTGFRLFKSDSALTFTQIGATVGTPVTGNVVRIDATGSTITIKNAGATVMTQTDTTVTSGRPGIQIFRQGATDSTTEIDSWSAADAAGGGNPNSGAGHRGGGVIQQIGLAPMVNTSVGMS